jgi:ABC-type Fe3+/spermidine/putrescine transport system ATPase subunit
MTKAHFEFRSISKSYDGRPALSSVSFSVSAGEPIAILGPSGSGKTTALRLLAGLEAPSAGSVLLDGKPVSEPDRILVPPQQRGVAMVFQDLALWPNLTVRQNVLLGLAGSGLTRAELRVRARKALGLCGIEAVADRLPGKISGGEQQRVALARAIAVQPTFLLLDEPFASLDLVLKARLVREIAALSQQQDMTVLLVTHDPLDATVLCRAAIVLGEHGRVEESGTLAALLADPHSEILKVFDNQVRGLASRAQH